MALFAISDIHLSFGVENKNMDIFKGWSDHANRLKANWNRVIGDEDTVVIGGDVSWGASFAECLPDFEFIANELNGNKILLKGNHDYWWTSLSKMRAFLAANKFGSIDFLHNNAYKVGHFTVCGTRGWINTDGGAGTGLDEGSEHFGEHDKKILLRESGRLETSVKAGIALGGEILVFLHYPPIYAREENAGIVEVIGKYAVKRVFSGHIHLSGMGKAFIGERNGTFYDMITADTLGFSPKKIDFSPNFT